MTMLRQLVHFKHLLLVQPLLQHPSSIPTVAQLWRFGNGRTSTWVRSEAVGNNQAVCRVSWMMLLSWCTDKLCWNLLDGKMEVEAYGKLKTSVAAWWKHKNSCCRGMATSQLGRWLWTLANSDSWEMRPAGNGWQGGKWRVT